MEHERAEAIVETVQEAWDWKMPPETFDLWTSAMEGLADGDAAELAVLDLFGSQVSRPRFAEVREQYVSIRRRIVEEEKAAANDHGPALAAAELDAPPGTPAEVRELVAALRGEGQRGGELVRAVLRARGVDAPPSEEHAGEYDPPLNVAEQRHRWHDRRGRFADVCRFCAVAS